MVEDDYEESEKTNTAVVIPLEGERWQHVNYTSDAEALGGSEGTDFLIYQRTTETEAPKR